MHSLTHLFGYSLVEYLTLYFIILLSVPCTAIPMVYVRNTPCLGTASRMINA